MKTNWNVCLGSDVYGWTSFRLGMVIFSTFAIYICKGVMTVKKFCAHGNNGWFDYLLINFLSCF